MFRNTRLVDNPSLECVVLLGLGVFTYLEYHLRFGDFTLGMEEIEVFIFFCFMVLLLHDRGMNPRLHASKASAQILYYTPAVFYPFEISGFMCTF